MTEQTMTAAEQRHEIDMARLKKLREYLKYASTLDIGAKDQARYEAETARIEAEWDNFIATR